MIWTIARRELVTKGRSKAFLIVTAIMFVAVIGGSVAITLLGGDDDKRDVTIGVVAEGVRYSEALEVGSDTLDVIVVVPNDGLAAVSNESIVVLFDGSTLTWKDFPARDLDDYVRSTVQTVAFGERAEALELSPEDIGSLFSEVVIDEVSLEADEDEFGIRVAAAIVSGIATFMLLQIWGSFMMMGVVEEKSSRVVEVLLSLVTPRTLLTGKIIGLGILALFQMLILVAGLSLGLVLVEDVEIPDGVWSTVPLLAIMFLLGFAFYATAFGAVGSMVSRQEDAQSAQLPVLAPLLVGYAIAITSIGNPDNVVVKVASWVPLTSPVVLPFRNAFTPLPLWEIALSIILLIASIVLMLRVGGWIYRYSLLRTGTRVTWSDLWRNRRADTISLD